MSSETVLTCPPDLRLVVITCKANLQCNINLSIMAQGLPLNKHIVGIRYKPFYNHIIRGTCCSKVSKVSKTPKNTNRKRKDFSNQCTIVYMPYPEDRPKYRLNMKIFSNGMTVITGATSLQDVQLALDYIRQQLKRVAVILTINPSKITEWFLNRFNDSSVYYDYMYKHYPLIIELINRYNYQLDLHLETIINPKNRQTNMIWSNEHPPPIQLASVIYLYDLLYSYYSPDQLKILLTNNHLSDCLLIELIDALEKGELVAFPVSFNLSLENPIKVEIQNYNTIYTAPFKINRTNISQILAQKYHMSTRFNFSVYPGVNAKYVCRLLCKRDNCTSSGSKRDTCGCKILTYLIFQEGTIIITGARDWRQILDAYHQIKNIIHKEKEQIIIRPVNCQSEIVPDNLPAMVYHEATNNYYLNKRHIMKHPRNYFLIQRFKWLLRYQNPKPSSLLPIKLRPIPSDPLESEENNRQLEH